MCKRKSSFYPPPPSHPVTSLCTWIVVIALILGLACLFGMCIGPIVGPPMGV